MGTATKEWWQARLNGSRKTGSQFDVTCTWTNAERANDTGHIAMLLKPLLAGARRVVDWGAGRGRFASVIQQDWGCEYIGVDILADLVQEMRSKNVNAWLYSGAPIPEHLDGDTAIFCLVIQHLTDEEAEKALKATRAKRVAIVDGVWKNDAYSTTRTQEELVSLLREARPDLRDFSMHVGGVLAKYKIVVGRSADAS